MNKLLLAITAAGMVGLGLAGASPAVAGPTNDQAAAESDLPSTSTVPAASAPGISTRGEGVIVNGVTPGGPADASNGLAQSRIKGGEELRQNAQ